MRNHSKQTFERVDAPAKEKEYPVLAPILALLDSVARRDRKAMLETLLPNGSTTVIRSGQVSQFNLLQLVDRLPGGTLKIEERIYDPIVLIDEDIAMVWARYEFVVDGKVLQYGTDLFNLVLCDQRWLIAGISYNSRQSR